ERRVVAQLGLHLQDAAQLTRRWRRRLVDVEGDRHLLFGLFGRLAHGTLRDGYRQEGWVVSDPWTHHVGLMSGADLFGDPLPRALEPAGVADHVCRDRRTPLGQLGEGGGLHVTEDGHGDRPRDRRRRHHQNVWRLLSFAAQRISLLDTEAVLLV